MKLPKVIYATIVEGKDGPWLNSDESLHDLVDDADVVTVGVYELKTTKRMKRVVQEVGEVKRAAAR